MLSFVMLFNVMPLFSLSQGQPLIFDFLIIDLIDYIDYPPMFALDRGQIFKYCRNILISATGAGHI